MTVEHSLTRADAVTSEEFPLSFAQQRMWFAEQLVPGSAMQNVPMAVRLSGTLDLGALRTTIGDLLARHDGLRTSFHVVAGVAVQRVTSHLEPAVDFADFTALSDPHSAVAGWLKVQAREPFDLRHAPLIRVAVARLSDTEHVFALTMHHLVCDGWSVGVLLEEFRQIYTARVRGEGADLPTPPIRYVDFSDQQRRQFESGAMERDLAYWREHLAGDVPALEMPCDGLRGGEPGYRGERVQRTVPAGLVAKLGRFAKEHGATPYMILLTGYAALLHRCTGQREIVIGSPIANRNRLAVEGVIGLFVNTLGLRIDLAGDPTFTDLLRRVRKAAVSGYGHQDLPFEKVIEDRRPDRGSHLAPLFQTMFVLQSDAAALRLPGLEASIVDVHNGTSRFELQMFVSRRGEEWVATLEYDSDLYERSSAERLIDRYFVVLENAMDGPGTRLSRVAVLSGTERQAVLAASSRRTTFPVPQCLHEVFESYVGRQPDAVALTCGDERLTYRELDSRAERLARLLRDAGIHPEDRVALFLERGFDQVIAILGVLKAGAAYVPMDPLYPAPRLARILGDAGPEILIAHTSLRDKLPEFAGQLMLMDDPRTWRLTPIGRPATTRPIPDNAAYVIYTSGSTGTPKGVHVAHTQVHRMFTSMRAATEALSFDETDVWTFFHSFAFDVSVVEMWGAFLHGGRLVVVPTEVAHDMEHYYDLLVGEGVTVLNQTPSAFAQLSMVDSGRDLDDLALRSVIFGGEALEPGTLRSWFDRHGDREPRLVNLYGITETIHVTTREITRDDLRLAGRSPIGLPLPDLELYVLDGALELAPVGVTGELFVGGPGLARCYFGDPVRTAERFVPNPYGAPGERLYQSGDLARVTARGELEYIGRADHQVKIRGYRIETGEIEAILLEHHAVHASVVLAVLTSSGDRQLVAYVGLERDVRPDPELVRELRAHVAERLPAYMVPSTVIALESLPLTVNGKVDRRALPRPDAADMVERPEYVAPRSQLEHRVAEIWAEVLQADRVGLLDNFFDLGGHSLLATRLVFRLREEFDTELPLRVLVSVPTVAGIAAVLQEAAPEEIDLTTEVWLGDGIHGYAADSAFRAVLVTGATGFLGAFLVNEILVRTEATVYCLVRGDDEYHAARRLRETFHRYELDFTDRIVAVPGDLARPGLGLSEDWRARLVERIDTVYHAGALVNLVFPYDALKAANVDGTREILRLAAATGRAAVHHISTVGVFAGSSTPLAEQDPTGPPHLLRQGYTQSKWVAEQVVELAARAGVPVTVHRPARIAGHSVTGACQTDDFLWRVIKGCVQAKAYPAHAAVLADLVPVDYVAASVVELSRGHFSGTYHQVNPRPIRLGQVLSFVRDFGFELAPVDLPTWLAAIRADQDNAAYPLLSVFESAAEADGRDVTFSGEVTAALVPDVECPPLDQKLFTTYLSFFVRTGFLNPKDGV